MSPARRRRPSIAILGLPYFGGLLARQLGARGWRARLLPHPGRDLRAWLAVVRAVLSADVVYVISSRVDRRSPQALLMLLRRRPVVVHWVGTDVLIALEAKARGDVSARLVRRAAHWCDAPWLAAELRPLGVSADHVPLPIPVRAGPPPPLPVRFRVLLYLPVDSFDREVFDIATLLRLPREFPDLDFVLIPSPASTLPGPLPSNLEARDWVEDMDALYAGISVVVRLTSHDGMSFMAVEALSRGRHVIWTYPIPGVVQATGFAQVSAALSALAGRHSRGELGLNEEGRAYVLEEFDPQRLLAGLDRRLRAIVRTYRSGRR